MPPLSVNFPFDRNISDDDLQYSDGDSEWAQSKRFCTHTWPLVNSVRHHNCASCSA
jgi:hypothetical protein